GPASQAADKLRPTAYFAKGTTSSLLCLAEALSEVEGEAEGCHQALYSCHSESASAREESAFRSFSAASSAGPVTFLKTCHPRPEQRSFAKRMILKSGEPAL